MFGKKKCCCGKCVDFEECYESTLRAARLLVQEAATRAPRAQERDLKAERERERIDNEVARCGRSPNRAEWRSNRDLLLAWSPLPINNSWLLDSDGVFKGGKIEAIPVQSGMSCGVMKVILGNSQVFTLSTTLLYYDHKQDVLRWTPSFRMME